MEDLIKEWLEEFNRQNELLRGEDDPLTASEFISCRIEDASNARAERREEHKREWWKTYRAALTGLHARRWSTPEVAHVAAKEAAILAHGELE